MAKILGLYLIILDLAVLLNWRRLRQVAAALEQNLLLIYFSGSIHLLLGLLLVTSHNIWTTGWQSVITTLGWITLFKGLVRLFFPIWLISWGEKSFDRKWLKVVVIAFLLIGIWLTGIGFGWW